MREAILAAALAAASMGSAAQAQYGAPAGTAPQPGGWGAGGWQSGGNYAPPANAGPTAMTPAYPQPNATQPPLPYGGYGSGAAAYAMPSSGIYKPIRVGKKLPGGYADPIYTVTDWRAYGLEQPYPGTRWIRYFDDAVLADARGRAIAVRPVAWNMARQRRPGPPPVGMQSAWTPPVASTRIERQGNTVVTTQVIPPPHAYHGGGYGPDYGWGPGVTVTPSIVTTTTTTVTEPASRATRHRRRAHRR
ncbi:RcnB family protein [Sphingomonas sp.]|uniref:RcnB family protein n=1 Tax=Sphingomonas sp. TaxID=28214 RepID=UPI003B00F6A1